MTRQESIDWIDENIGKEIAWVAKGKIQNIVKVKEPVEHHAWSFVDTNNARWFVASGFTLRKGAGWVPMLDWDKELDNLEKLDD